MPLEQNHLREAVLSALGAAEVPLDIALGVLQILTEAGYDGLRAAPWGLMPESAESYAKR